MLAAFGNRLIRIYRKSADLYRTSHSVRRVILYNSRYLIQKIPYLVRMFITMISARAEISHIRRAKAATHETFLLFTSAGSGIGDDIVMTRFIRDFSLACPDVVINVAVSHPTRMEWLTTGIPRVTRVFHESIVSSVLEEYYAVIQIGHAAVPYEPVRLAQGEISSSAVDVLIERLSAFRTQYADVLVRMPYSANELSKVAKQHSRTRADFLHFQAGLAYGGDRLEIAGSSLGSKFEANRDGAYLTIHNGFDPNFVISQPVATKCYPHFAAVIRKVRASFPGLKVVQLGVSATSLPIAGIDLDLRDKTSIREAASILQGASMHIDIDSGLVHLAAALGVQSCAVFGPSPAEYFGYPGNINIPPTFCGNCWWVNESWMDQCPLGFPDARCMLEQDPSDVANAIIARLAQNGVGRNVSSRTDSAATWDQDLPGTGAKLSHASLEHSDAARAIP